MHWCRKWQILWLIAIRKLPIKDIICFFLTQGCRTVWLRQSNNTLTALHVVPCQIMDQDSNSRHPHEQPWNHQSNRTSHKYDTNTLSFHSSIAWLIDWLYWSWRYYIFYFFKLFKKYLETISHLDPCLYEPIRAVLTNPSSSSWPRVGFHRASQD